MFHGGLPDVTSHFEPPTLRVYAGLPTGEYLDSSVCPASVLYRLGPLD
jgi:hypothetical protein